MRHAVLQQSQRLSAWNEQPREGKAARPNLRGFESEIACAKFQRLAVYKPSGTSLAESESVTIRKPITKEALCYIEPLNCVGSSAFQSTRRPTALGDHPSAYDRMREQQQQRRRRQQLVAQSRATRRGKPCRLCQQNFKVAS